MKGFDIGKSMLSSQLANLCNFIDKAGEQETFVL